jgi:hypothetical protein
MHTEHLQNVRPGLVALSWLMSIMLTSAIMMVVIGLNLVDPDSVLGTRVAIGAVAVGFFGGGLFVGTRAGAAPILHGMLIGLFSLVVWFLINVVASVAFPSFGWQALTPNLAIGLVLVMMGSAIVGTRSGYRRMKK